MEIKLKVGFWLLRHVMYRKMPKWMFHWLIWNPLREWRLKHHV